MWASGSNIKATIDEQKTKVQIDWWKTSPTSKFISILETEEVGRGYIGTVGYGSELTNKE